MTILYVVGARPNFMKVAPIYDAFQNYITSKSPEIKVEQYLVHTGQHYDHAMSELFFDNLGMPRPDVNLEIGSGTHGQQTGRIMENFEQVLFEWRPDLVLVVGDVNSTMACTIDAKKLGIPVAHVEAGLRSRDMTMPEEINRIVTDALADLLLTTDRGANKNLVAEGVSEDRIHFVGNVMIDSLLKHREKALKLLTLKELDLLNIEGITKDYAVLTLHRPGNVDNPEVLKNIGEALVQIGKKMPVIFPIHPRTRGRLESDELKEIFSEKNNIRLLQPLGYLDFLNLMANALIILTDSGGIQEESTILDVPCLTLRPNTERPVTIEQGTNLLVGNQRKAIIEAFQSVLAGKIKKGRAPELWDGHAADRIVEVLTTWFKSRSNNKKFKQAY
jgi:UDP-N-acetylglucosamine 2-epimerase (non-hydrolysing)